MKKEMKEAVKRNAEVLEREFSWLSEVIRARLDLYWNKECAYKSIYDIQPPELDGWGSNYADFVIDNELNLVERFVLILALTPHVKAEVLDILLTENKTYEKKFTEFGGYQSDSSGFKPTGETALFILSNDSLYNKFVLQSIFDGEHPFAREGILKLEPVSGKGTLYEGLLTLSQEYVDYLTTGEVRKPDFSPDFPAKLVTTTLEWEDLILKPSTCKQLSDIKEWLDYGHILLNGWGLSGRIKPGYRSLFHGPPGTGKTLAACLLGKLADKDVYRIDLSMVVSKYIGETEKNLAKVFDKGEHKDWILFFDEADALFGKRGETNTANDRHANQQVAYLLQRIEDYDGLVILATNLKENMDAAFMRRFQSIIHFSLPGVQERQQLWEKAFSPKSVLEEKIDIKKIAEKHKVSGALISNAVQYASIKTLARDSNIIMLTDLEGGIRRELAKEGVTLS